MVSCHFESLREIEPVNHFLHSESVSCGISGMISLALVGHSMVNPVEVIVSLKRLNKIKTELQRGQRYRIPFAVTQILKDHIFLQRFIVNIF